MALLRDGAKPSFRDARGKTPLIAAAERGMVGVVEGLVAAGAGLEDRMEKGITALTQAARMESPGACIALLGLGADPRAAEDDGTTTLHLCGLDDSGKMGRVAEFLLDAGADHEARDANGATPLFIAAVLGSSNVCATLLRAGANPETADDHGNAALSLADGRCAALLGSAMERRALERESDDASGIGGARQPTRPRAMRL